MFRKLFLAHIILLLLLKSVNAEKIDKIITAHGRFHFLRLFITILLIISMTGRFFCVTDQALLVWWFLIGHPIRMRMRVIVF